MGWLFLRRSGVLHGGESVKPGIVHGCRCWSQSQLISLDIHTRRGRVQVPTET